MECFPQHSKLKGIADLLEVCSFEPTTVSTVRYPAALYLTAHCVCCMLYVLPEISKTDEYEYAMSVSKNINYNSKTCLRIIVFLNLPWVSK